MVNDRFFVLTGTFGSGKSTLVEHLESCGIRGIVEPARPILAEQRSIEGNRSSEKDPRIFIELMLSRMLHAYRQSDAFPGPIFFDGVYQIFWAMLQFSALSFRVARRPLISTGTTVGYSWLRRGSRFTARMTSVPYRSPWRKGLGGTFERSTAD